MMAYRRTYTPPVFHTESADEKQKNVMRVVFDTLRNSGIDFCVVRNSDKRNDELFIKSYGSFTLTEKSEILAEVVQMYIKDRKINHIEME